MARFGDAHLAHDDPYLVIPCIGVAEILIHVKATDALAFIVEGTTDKNWPADGSGLVPVGCRLESTSGYTRKLPGATVTPPVNNGVRISPAGFANIRLRWTTGEGDVRFGTSPLGHTDPILPTEDQPLTTLLVEYDFTANIAGGAAILALNVVTPAGTRFVSIPNPSETLDMWVLQNTTVGAPTLTSRAHASRVIPPGDSYDAEVGAGVYIWVKSADAALTIGPGRAQAWR